MTLRWCIGVLVLALTCTQPSAAGADDSSHRSPASKPATHTPSVRNGYVSSIVRMGKIVVIGGTFTRISSAGSKHVVKRRYIAAFNRRTGKLVRGFRPRLNRPVVALEASRNGRSVYVGGEFTRVNRHKRSSLVRLNVRSGRVTRGFRFPGTNSDVRTVVRRKGRLYIGGSFERVGRAKRRGLAVVSAKTGRLRSYRLPGLRGSLNGVHGHDRGQSSAISLDVTPNGKLMVVTGNFSRVGSRHRVQVALIRLGRRGVVSRWSTRRYRPRCARSLYTYMRAVQFSPGGGYFVVVTSGGKDPGTLCDSAARWNTKPRRTHPRPSWVDWTGGDSLLSVAVTGSAVYVGGHQRWMNNPDGFNRAKGGAVPRPSLAALSPDNGLPLAWNPGRNPRGKGVTALLADKTGLWVGGDTAWIGNHRYPRPRIAHFAKRGGAALPRERQYRLPGKVYQLGSAAAGPGRRSARAVAFNGRRPRGPARELTGARVHPKRVRGAFVVDRTIFFGHSSGRLYRQRIRGHRLGRAVRVNPYGDPKWAHVSTGSGGTYRGRAPKFYRQIRSVTGMFYRNGRLYYSRRNSKHLFWRDFSVDSGIVGVRAHKVKGGPNWRDATGVFRSGSTVYFSDRDTGRLFRTRFRHGRLVGRALVRRANAHGVDWNSRGSFVYNRARIE